jgi:hypothetical protein
MTLTKKLLAIGLLLLFLTFLYLKLGLNFSYSEIQAKDLVSSDSGIDINQIFSSPNSGAEACFFAIPKTINLIFKKPTDLNGFSVFFPGSANPISRYPSDFDIYSVDFKGVKTPLVSERNFRNSSFKYLTPRTFTTSVLQMTFKRAPFNKYDVPIRICLQDFKFYGGVRTDLIKSTLDYLSSSQSVINYWVYYVLFLSVLLIPGYAFLQFLNFVRKLKIDAELILIFSPVISITLMVILGVIRLITGAQWLYGLYWLLFLASFVYLFVNKSYQDVIRQKTTILIWFTALLVVFLPIARRDYLSNVPYIGAYLDGQNTLPFEKYPGYFIDSLLPWGFGRTYYHQYALNSPEAKALMPNTPVYDKPPLFPLMVTTLIGLFGERHFVYQRFLETLVSLYYVTFYLLIKKRCSRPIAIIVVLMMFINVQLSQMPINVEVYYKYFALYPVLLSLVLLSKQLKENLWGIGLLLGMAFLIHPSTLIYSGAILAMYFIDNHHPLRFIRRTLPITLILTTLVGMWYLFPKISGLDKLSSRENSFYFGEMTKTEGNLVRNKTLILISLFIPNPRLKGEKAAVISPFSGEYLYQFFRYSLLMNLTPLLLFYLVFNYSKAPTKNWRVVLLGTVPLVIYWLLYLHRYDRWYGYGSTFFLLFPFVVPMILSYVAERLSLASIPVRTIIITSYIFFMAVALYFLSGLFVPCGNRLLSTDILTLFNMILFAGLSVILIRATCSPTGK